MDLTPEQHARVREIFDAVADLSPAEREAWYEHHGVDPQILREVRALIGGWPPRIGPYDVEQRIGRGGMGTVYLAASRSPVRMVALKVLHHGSPAIIARFRQEAQVLAAMDHRGIAAIFDADTAGERHYIAMEFVDGEPIDAYCDRHRLTIRDRVVLLAKVTAAVAHAHQKGVIHRDLTPGNVLVTDAGEPKVIDFGIGALADDADLQRLTVEGTPVGTPGFMSPEQVAGRPADVRMDVYALGAMLRALLAGSPVEPSDVGDNGDREPRLASQVAQQVASEIADQRSTDGSQLVDDLTGDLDAIIAKCLEPEADKRYQSVNDLEDDLRNHLAHQPIRARTPGTWERMQRFARRHRTLVRVTAGAGLAILIAGIFVVVFAVQANAALANFDSLSLVERYRKAQASRAALAPPWPENLAAIDDWLREYGEPLEQSIPLAQDTLNRLRELAPPRTPDEVEHDLATSPHRAKAEEASKILAKWRSEIGDGSTLGDRERDVMATLERVAVDLDRKRRERRTYRMPSDSEQHLHDALADLLAELKRFCHAEQSELDEVRQWRAWAASVYQNTITDHRAAWDAAIQRIREHPEFGGLRIAPQVGLIPLGPDPESDYEEFVHLRSGSVPTRDPDSEALQLQDDFGIVFVLLPGGAFRMGATPVEGEPNHDPLARPDEGPPHQVTLAPFLIGKYEVTQHQWTQLDRTLNPSAYRPDSKSTPQPVIWRNPVENMNWTAADGVMRRAGLALPTEAQWEYAARAGTDTPWFTGKNKLDLIDKVNIADLTRAAAPARWDCEDWLTDRYVLHAPVGTFGGNGFGLHDVYGNVMEWCVDWVADYDRPTAPDTGLRQVTGPTGRVRGKVVRGGSCGTGVGYARSAARMMFDRAFRSTALGVRAARELQF